MLDFAFIRDNWLFIAGGIGATLGVTIFSFLLATPIAAIVARGRRSTSLPIKLLFSLYALLIDRVPLYIQILFVFLALPQLGVSIPGFVAAIMVLTLNYSSRLSEDFLRIYTTQGKTLISLTPLIPHIINNMIKDSAMLSAGHLIHEVTERAMLLGRREFKNLEAFIMAGVIYLILITGVTLGAKFFKLKTTAPSFGNQGAA